MRCKACNVVLDQIRDRFIDDLGQAVPEDLCFTCLEIAMAAVFNKDLTDDQMYALEYGDLIYVEHEDTSF